MENQPYLATDLARHVQRPALGPADDRPRCRHRLPRTCKARWRSVPHRRNPHAGGHLRTLRGETRRSATPLRTGTGTVSGERLSTRSVGRSAGSLSGDYARVHEEALALESRSNPAPHEESLDALFTIWRARAELGLDDADGAEKTMNSLERSGRTLPRSGEAWRLLVRGYPLEASGKTKAARSRYREVRSLHSPEYDTTASMLPEQALDGRGLNRRLHPGAVQ
jgi:hypothetical protein